MKTTVYSLSVALSLAALAVVSCSPKTPEGPDTVKQTISVFPTKVTFGSEAESTTITVTASGAWTASRSDSWVSVEPSSGTGNASVNISAGRNTTSDRSTEVVFAITSDKSVRATVSVSQPKAKEEEAKGIEPSPRAFDGNKRASTTYQLLVYSFADGVRSDKVGDFKGIEDNLDYLDALGVTAIWLSPSNKTSSYHGYDVDDYYTLNPLYSSDNTAAGAEADFKSLIDKAHAKGIKVYMDYVLNHSGRNNAWFQDVLSNPDSPYKEYYVLSQNPDADVAAGKIDNYGGAKDPGMGGWHSFTVGNKGYSGRLHFKVNWGTSSKTVTVTQTTDAAQSPNTSSPKVWLWYGNISSPVGLYETSSGVHEITIDFNSDWGFLVRSSATSWDNGTKWGAKAGAGSIVFGTPFTLDSSTAGDITFGGVTNNYFASFDTSMPDLNYGPYDKAKDSKAFKDIAASAKKWIDMGVDGFRLDAVRWIYQHGTNDANPEFLRQWYEECNSYYKASGHTDDIFMVGEAWMDSHSQEKNYYKGIPSCFEFHYWYALRDMLNSGKAQNFVSTVSAFVSDHSAIRPDAQTSFFLTNHDEDRAGSDLSKNIKKMKQAGAILLTSPGRPFIYQGEELGYWGTKSGGDEYVRTPIMWDKAGSKTASKGVNGKVDTGMLTSAISVEAQDSDASSILSVYRTFSRLRNTYPALADGKMSATGITGASIAAWYMTSGSEKLLVIHNVASSTASVTVGDDMSRPIALLGSATVQAKKLTLGGNSSVVFEL